MTKEAVRKSMRFFRRNMAENERKEKDALIHSKLSELVVFRDASYFFPFVSYGTEVDTIAVLEGLLADGRKRVAVPRVHGKEMDFYFIRSLTDLKKGCMGILEPVTQERAVITEGIMLIPGLAFDEGKNRIGYGGGYYDRYLEKHGCERVIKIGIAYDFQVLERLEAKSYDKKVDMILTDRRIIE
ncbi:MAG: 5-formyltetrahydrofolate cyclo-ligase [Lachnospiraceae bacterium]|nr:5-formyltetrahydrofolate cyclo-ligase [Lachnospiraceae bacterium]